MSNNKKHTFFHIHHKQGGHAQNIDLTEGAIVKKIIQFAIPLFLGQLLQQFYNGARDYKSVQKAIHSNFLFGVVSSVLATVAGLLFIPTLLTWMKTPAEVMPHSLLYFRIYFAGVATVILYNICMSIMQALGDSLHPLYYLIFSSLVNRFSTRIFCCRQSDRGCLPGFRIR